MTTSPPSPPPLGESSLGHLPAGAWEFDEEVDVECFWRCLNFAAWVAVKPGSG